MLFASHDTVFLRWVYDCYAVHFSDFVKDLIALSNINPFYCNTVEFSCSSVVWNLMFLDMEIWFDLCNWNGAVVRTFSPLSCYTNALQLQILVWMVVWDTPMTWSSLYLAAGWENNFSMQNTYIHSLYEYKCFEAINLAWFDCSFINGFSYRYANRIVVQSWNDTLHYEMKVTELIGKLCSMWAEEDASSTHHRPMFVHHHTDTHCTQRLRRIVFGADDPSADIASDLFRTVFCFSSLLLLLCCIATQSSIFLHLWFVCCDGQN